MDFKKTSFIVLSGLIVTMFALACILPTLTTIKMGGDSINSLSDGLLAFSADILLISSLIISFLIYLKNKETRFTWHFIDKIVIGFILINILYGFIISGEPKIAFLAIRITYLPIGFYFLARLFQYQNVLLSRKIVHNVFMIFALLAMIGLVLYFIFPQVNEKLNAMSGNIVSEYFIQRMGSLYLTPVVFATVMAFSAIYFYQRYLIDNSKKDLLLLLLVWVCLLLSVSRGPIMSFGVAFIVLSLIYKKYILSFFAGIGMLLTAICISFYATGNLNFLLWLFKSSAQTVGMKKDVTRVNFWETSINDFMAQPWGYGLGKAGHVAHRHLMDVPNVKASLYSTDGWFLKMACENGVLGLTSYLILSIFLLILLVKHIRIATNEMIILALGLFIIVNIQSIFSNTLDFHPLIAFYWLIIGFSINTYYKHEV